MSDFSRRLELCFQFNDTKIFALYSVSPPSNTSIHDSMCNRYCLASDLLRTSAMEASHCDCMELSTKNTSDSYTKDGDFCATNSAL